MAPPIDDEAVLERVAGDVELLGRLVAMFASDAPERLETMRGALGAADAIALARAAHGLKGALAVLGADAAAAEAYRLEQCGKRGELGEAPALLAHLERQVDEVHASLAALVRRLSQPGA
jgi:HPt (histidine-containing phosphotransfer) domain-containing protein